MRRAAFASRAGMRVSARRASPFLSTVVAFALLAGTPTLAETPGPGTTDASEVALLDARFPRHVTPPNVFPANTLSAAEREAGWALLFDGQNGDAWRSRDGDGFPEEGWTIAGGALRIEAAGAFELRAGGDLFSVERYRDFVLDFEFALTPGANSGVKYRAQSRSRFGFVDAIGCEYQILDDARHPDADRGRDGNRKLASLYDIVAADSPWPRAIGSWNHGRIHFEDGALAHYLNGDRVLVVDFRTPAWSEALAESKFAGVADYCADTTGHIALQDHGDAVRFRNLRIRALDRPQDAP